MICQNATVVIHKTKRLHQSRSMVTPVNCQAPKSLTHKTYDVNFSYNNAAEILRTRSISDFIEK